MLCDDFVDLNDRRITFPGHQGYGYTLAQTNWRTESDCYEDIRFQTLIRLINVFWKLTIQI